MVSHSLGLIPITMGNFSQSPWVDLLPLWYQSIGCWLTRTIPIHCKAYQLIHRSTGIMSSHTLTPLSVLDMCPITAASPNPSDNWQYHTILCTPSGRTFVLHRWSWSLDLLGSRSLRYALSSSHPLHNFLGSCDNKSGCFSSSTLTLVIVCCESLTCCHRRCS